MCMPLGMNILWASMGGSYTNQSKLNESIKDIGLSPIRQNFSQFGVGYLGISDRLSYGVDLNLLVHTNSAVVVGDTTRPWMRAMQLTPRIGYSLYAIDELHIFPSLGVGVGGNYLRSLDDNTGKAKKYNACGSYLDAAVNVLFTQPVADNRNLSVVVNAQVGYLYTPLGWKMKIPNSAISPVLSSPQGIYFRICVGMGPNKY